MMSCCKMVLKFSHRPEIDSRGAVQEDIQYMMALESELSPIINMWSHEEHTKKIADPDVAQIIIEVDSKPIGYVIVQGLTSPHVLTITRLAVAVPRQGYGRAIINSIIDYAFYTKSYNRLWLDVLTTNEVAYQLYLSMGFTLEGTLRENEYHEGRYYSYHILSILQREYALENSLKESSK